MIRIYKHYLTVYVYVNYAAWLASFIFHYRDTYYTEKIDYFFAGLTMFYGLYLSSARLLSFDRRYTSTLQALIFGGYALHFGRMLIYKFDYGQNMLVCISAGILAQAIWIVVALKYNDNANRLRLLIFIVGLNLAMGLEVFDFPPYYKLVDAHALWHLVTPFLIPVFYNFVFTDVKTIKQG